MKMDVPPKVNINEELVEQSSISMFTFDCFYIQNKNKKIFIKFASILGAHILFFVLTPFLVVLWTTKWCSYGLFWVTKKAV